MSGSEIPSERPRIVIAGGSGFVGRALARKLSPRGDVVCLTRNPERARAHHPDLDVEWVQCDLYSLTSVTRALEGATYAFYLVHSMSPSGGLTQATFDDLDLLLADNFARAAQSAKVAQIIYLGGLLPSQGGVSSHLRSREEVEHVLSGVSVPVTILRAGLVVGAGGSSFQMLRKLVSRLPAMVLPAWTETRTTPIALSDVVEIMVRSMGDEGSMGVTSDIGGPDTVTYRQMLALTAQELGGARPMLDIPLLTPRLSALWVHFVTGSPMELVRPLIQSLECEMVASHCLLQDRFGIRGLGLQEALRVALRDEARMNSTASSSSSPRAPAGARPSAVLRRRTPPDRVVRSVQRLPLPQNHSVEQVAGLYGAWLGRAFRWLLRTETSPDRIDIFGRFPNRLLLSLVLNRESSHPDRQVYDIAEGALVRRTHRRARFEFREVPTERAIITAIHDFSPRLPWWIYKRTQALLHLWVMSRFGRILRRIGSGGPRKAEQPEGVAPPAPTTAARLQDKRA